MTKNVVETRIQPPLTQQPLHSDAVSFRYFAIMWAIASLFHMAHSSVFDVRLNYALLTLSALFVVFRPGLGSFTLFIVCQLFDVAFRMPEVTNHWIFTAFVNVTLLYILIRTIWTRRSFMISGGEWYHNSAPVLRVLVIILYFFAVFHKLNAGFFTSTSSCAVYLLHAQQFEKFIPLPGWFYRINPYLKLLIEAAIPVLLCIPRGRLYGILLGIFFHCVLSYSNYNAFYDFSSMVFAAYFLFLDESFVSKMHERITGNTESLKKFFKHFSLLRLLALFIFAGITIGTFYLLNLHLDTPRRVHLYFFWTIYSLTCLYLLIRFWKYGSDRQLSFSFYHPSLWVFPFLVFLNGTSPYFGLKTENSFSMFSNLQTERGVSNHLIVPASMQLFDYQHQIVDIIDSSHDGLKAFAANNEAMVLFEFRRFVNSHNVEYVRYRLNGEERLYEKQNKATHPGSNPFVLEKLMKFRMVHPPGEQPCKH